MGLNLLLLLSFELILVLCHCVLDLVSILQFQLLVTIIEKNLN